MSTVAPGHRPWIERPGVSPEMLLGAMLSLGVELEDMEARGSGLIAIVEYQGQRFRVQLDPFVRPALEQSTG